MRTTSVESKSLSSALRRSGSLKVQERGPGSKKIADPAERADLTASIITAGGSSSKQQPATKSPRASLRTCGQASNAVNATASSELSPMRASSQLPAVIC